MIFVPAIQGSELKRRFWSKEVLRKELNVVEEKNVEIDTVLFSACQVRSR